MESIVKKKREKTKIPTSPLPLRWTCLKGDLTSLAMIKTLICKIRFSPGGSVTPNDPGNSLERITFNN